MNWFIKAIAGAAGPYIVGALGAVSILALGWGLQQSISLREARLDLKAAKAQALSWAGAYKTCSANFLDAQQKLEKQSAQVKALSVESTQRLAATTKAQAQARTLGDSYRALAQAILLKRPGPDVCASADALIVENVR